MNMLQAQGDLHKPTENLQWKLKKTDIYEFVWLKWGILVKYIK